MGHRPRRLVVGLTLVTAALVMPRVAASQPAPDRPGAVAADGTVTDGTWEVHHLAPGVYRVQGAGIDVTRWDAVADVSILPIGGGVDEIRFVAGGAGVDTAFSFTGRP